MQKSTFRSSTKNPVGSSAGASLTSCTAPWNLGSLNRVPGTTSSADETVVNALRAALSSKSTVGTPPGVGAASNVRLFRVHPRKMNATSKDLGIRIVGASRSLAFDELGRIDVDVLQEKSLRIKRTSIVGGLKARKPVSLEPLRGDTEAVSRSLHGGLAFACLVESVLPIDPHKEALAEAAMRRNSGPSVGRKLSSK